jgi:hypothetical protein
MQNAAVSCQLVRCRLRLLLLCNQHVIGSSTKGIFPLSEMDTFLFNANAMTLDTLKENGHFPVHVSVDQRRFKTSFNVELLVQRRSSQKRSTQ